MTTDIGRMQHDFSGLSARLPTPSMQRPLLLCDTPTALRINTQSIPHQSTATTRQACPLS